MTQPSEPLAAPPASAASGIRHRLPHALVLLVPVVAIALIALGVNRIEPVGPGRFYTPPAPLPEGAPGTVIRSHPVPGAPAGAQAWSVLYLSTGPDGERIAVSGSVFAPIGAPPTGGRPVVAWAHPTTGVARRCAPSLETAGGAAAVPGLTDLLSAGYVVAATDYPGLGTPGPHPYLIGASEATAVLDSVRAARNLPAVGAGTRVALWGHSQGGHAALFAGQMAPAYAPELTLVGVAAAAPATDLVMLLQRDIGGVAGNVLASMAVQSWSRLYAAQGLKPSDVLEPEAIPTARLIADYCIETESQALVELPEAEVLKVRFLAEAPWTVPGWDAVLRANTPGAAAIKVPVLINQGSADTTVWPGVTADWITAQCHAGVAITEKVYDGLTHTQIARLSAGDTARWLTARFNGDQAAPGCPAP
jgi:alpha-beta hydrolase superfamily lysophospholipase